MKAILILGAVALITSASAAFASTTTTPSTDPTWSDTRFNLKCEFRKRDAEPKSKAECTSDAVIYHRTDDATAPGILWTDLLTIRCDDRLEYADSATLFLGRDDQQQGRGFRLMGDANPRPFIDLPHDTFRKGETVGRSVKAEREVNFDGRHRELRGECYVERNHRD